MSAAITAGSLREAMKLAHAAGTDAGNRSMRKAGRLKWTAKDYEAAADAYRAAMTGLGYDLARVEVRPG